MPACWPCGAVIGGGADTGGGIAANCGEVDGASLDGGGAPWNGVVERDEPSMKPTGEPNTCCDAEGDCGAGIGIAVGDSGLS